MQSPRCCVVFLIAVLAVAADASQPFPTESRFVNVRTYGARGDDTTDDTASIQRAIRENIGETNAGVTLYFPAGTYIVSNTLYYRLADTSGWSAGWRCYLTIQGESRDSTTIRLKDSAPGFNNTASPKSIFYTASTDSQNVWDDALGNGNEAFHNNFYDITISTGKGNGGAIGINYLAHNKATICNVKVWSEDGRGVCGIYLRRPWSGPNLIQHVEVVGFNYGFDVANMDLSTVLDDITLKNQRVAGIRNDQHPLSIHKLTSTNTVPVIQNNGYNGLVVVVDGIFNGGSATACAIENNRGHLFARNIKTTGYKAALENYGAVVAGVNIDEFASDRAPSLFPSPQKSLNLPIQSAPTYADNDFADWYIVKPNGVDDTANLQKAMDSGKSTICMARGQFRINNTVRVRGNVRRIIGMESCIRLGTGYDNPAAPRVVFRFEEGTGPFVVMERVNTVSYQEGPGAVWVEQATSKTLVLKDLYFGYGISYRSVAGTGSVFIEDCTSNDWRFGHGQNAWCRQLNPENKGPKITNDGAYVWILGLKTECNGTVVKTINGGCTEVLGGLFFPGAKATSVPTTDVAFVSVDSCLSLSYVTQVYKSGEDYTLHVKETRAGVTKTLNRCSVADRDMGSAVTFYTSYGAATPAELTATVASSTRVNLMWHDQSANETGFEIERRTGDTGSFAKIGSAGVGAIAYADTTVGPSTIYVYRVRAVSSAGPSAYSNEARVLTPANTPPVVAITVPANNATFVSGTAITITAAASDSGGVQKVEFFVGTQLLGTDTTAPFTFSWTNAALGSHVLTARATDNAGATMTSSAIYINVAAPNHAPAFTSAPSATPNPADVNMPVSFFAVATDADGDALTFEWNFGDGTKAPAASATHTFVAAGTYSVTIKATDSKGAVVSKTLSVEITAAPQQPPFAAKINFQLAGGPIPGGYLQDNGHVFGDRGDGLSYGWTADVADAARDRNSPASPDQRYDTLIHMQKFTAANWEIAVPNGAYSVRVVCGDPSYFNGVYRLNVEGVLSIDGVPTSTQRWFSDTRTVTVTDGRLSLTNAAGATNNKLCFVEVNAVTGTTSSSLAAMEATFEPLQIKSMQVGMNLQRAENDRLTLTAELPGLPADLALEKLYVGVDLAGAVFEFNLNKKGAGANRIGKCKLAYNKRSGAFTLMLMIKKGDWAILRTDGGVETGSSVPLAVRIGERVFGGAKSGSYSTKAGKSALIK